MRLAVAVVLLAGCATDPTHIPVPVPCVAALPVKPETCKPKDDSRQEYLRCVLVDCERTRGYALELEAALTGCVGESK